MQTITSGNRVVGLFPAFNGQGPFDGFGDGQPPNGTNLNAAFLNSVQQELVNVIVGQGIILNGVQTDQLKQAIDDYTFGSPTIGGVLSIGDGVNPALITVLAFAVSEIQSGGEFAQRNGSTWTVETGVTLAASGDNTWVWGATNANDWTINGNVTLGTGTGASTVTVGADAADALTVNATTGVKAALSMNAALLILGASGGSLSTDPTATCQFNGTLESNGRTRVLGSTSIASGDLSNSSGRLRWRDSIGTKYVHTSTAGLALAHGHATTLPAAATITLDTSAAVAPAVATTLSVEAEFWLQRAVAGDVTISLIEVGVGQIGTNRVARVNATAGTTWDRFTFSRPHSASTTARVYQLSIDGGGSNVTGAECRIMVRPTTSA